MRLFGALIVLFAAFGATSASAQTYRVLPIETYAKVALNTTFQFNLEENAVGVISKAEIDPGLGISMAAGISPAPEFDTELEFVTYRGSVDNRTVAGVPVAVVPKDDIMLLAVMVNGYYKLAPAANARIKLGGGIGYGQYTLDAGSGMKSRGNGLVYQVKATGEYDITPNFAFAVDGGYIGTTDFDVDVVGVNVDTALDGITFGVGGKFKF